MVANMMATWLQQCYEFAVIGCACNCEQGWGLCAAHHPDVVLLDVKLSGADGLLLAERLQQQMPETKTLVVSARQDPWTLHRIQQLGVSGYVCKTSSIETLRPAILSVFQGQRYYTTPFTLDPQVHDISFQILSSREIEVFRVAATGCSIESTARQLNITCGTTRKHLSNIRRKLNVHSRAELFRYAMKIGMIP